MAAARKFQPGDTVWLYDANRRKWDEDRRLIYEYGYVSRFIVGVSGRSYEVAYGGGKGYSVPPRRVGFDAAERLYKTTAEKDADVYCHDNRQRLIDLLRSADAATLRRVAAALEPQDAIPDAPADRRG